MPAEDDKLLGKEKCKAKYTVPIIVTGIVIVFTTTFCYLASSQWAVDVGLYKEGTSNVSANHETEITPAGFTFLIWSVIFAWQILWGVYTVTTIFRKGLNGPLYYNPLFIRPAFYYTYCVANLFTVTWLFIWAESWMIPAFIIILIASIGLNLSLWINVKTIAETRPELEAAGMPKEPKYVVAFIHNGIGMYAAWVDIATLLSLSIVLAYGNDKGPGKMSNEDASTLCLVLLAVEFMIWFLVDVIKLDDYTRWLVTPYFVLPWALGGIVDKWYEPGVVSRNPIISIVLLAFALLLLLIKLVISTYRECKTNKDN